MTISNMHDWLGRASGGAGPVMRWIWGSLIALCAVGMAYMATLVFN